MSNTNHFCKLSRIGFDFLSRSMCLVLEEHHVSPFNGFYVDMFCWASTKDLRAALCGFEEGRARCGPHYHVQPMTDNLSTLRLQHQRVADNLHRFCPLDRQVYSPGQECPNLGRVRNCQSTRVPCKETPELSSMTQTSFQKVTTQ